MFADRHHPWAFAHVAQSLPHFCSSSPSGACNRSCSRITKTKPYGTAAFRANTLMFAKRCTTNAQASKIDLVATNLSLQHASTTKSDSIPELSGPSHQIVAQIGCLGRLHLISHAVCLIFFIAAAWLLRQHKPCLFSIRQLCSVLVKGRIMSRENTPPFNESAARSKAQLGNFKTGCHQGKLTPSAAILVQLCIEDQQIAIAH